MNLLQTLRGRFRSLTQRREAKQASLGEATAQDVRFGLRMLRKNPGFAAIGILTLALGVAGNIVIFTVYDSLYLRPFPFAEPDRLVDLDETAPHWNLEYTGLSYPDFDAWRKENRSFEAMAAWNVTDRILSFEDTSAWVRGVRVSREMMSVLRIHPMLGRDFTPEEDQVGGAKVLLLANGFWKRHFGGREDIVGQAVRLNHEAYTVIGVLPPDENVFMEGEFWVPLAYDMRAQQGHHLRGVGRLKPGMTLAKAREDLARVHRSLIGASRADENTSPRLTSLSDRYFGGTRAVIRVLLGMVVVVLLIACGNVAALMLARGIARGRELGLRISLGATRWRLARLVGVESLLLAGLGGLAGVALGNWGLEWLLNSLPERPPRWVSFEIDWRVWLFAGLMVALSALLGALPLIRSALKLDLRAIVQSSGQQSTASGGGRRSLHLLVVGEMALTLVVMVQAGLLYRTFRHVQNVDPGYRPDHLLVCDIALPENRYASKEAKKAFFREHLDRVRRLPGVVSASAITAPPLGGHSGTFFVAEDAPPRGLNELDPVVLQRLAFPGYFETMGIPILGGREFTERDGLNEGSRVVIVNETFAKQFWPGQDPVGKRIRHRYAEAPWMTVVGVAHDVKHYGLDQRMTPGVYIPFAQNPQAHMAFVIRSSVSPTSLAPGIRALVRQSDPELPVLGVVSMEERLHRSMWARRLTASLCGIFSGVALLMAAGGIYGVFSYVVNRRTQEIGVRLALGAGRGAILWLVIRQGLVLSALGAAFGLGGALLISPVTRNLLYDVSPFEPFTFATVTLGLLCVAVLACWVPARRAMKVQPMEALRCE